MEPRLTVPFQHRRAAALCPGVLAWTRPTPRSQSSAPAWNQSIEIHRLSVDRLPPERPTHPCSRDKAIRPVLEHHEHPTRSKFQHRPPRVPAGHRLSTLERMTAPGSTSRNRPGLLPLTESVVHSHDQTEIMQPTAAWPSPSRRVLAAQVRSGMRAASRAPCTLLASGQKTNGKLRPLPS